MSSKAGFLGLTITAIENKLKAIKAIPTNAPRNMDLRFKLEGGLAGVELASLI